MNDTAPRVIKHSVSISGHRTSISLEAPFWEDVRRLAALNGQSLSQFIAAVDAGRGAANLSSALRVAVLMHYRERAPASDDRVGVTAAPARG